MPTATKTFTAELDGDLIEIRAGLDYVADGHELLRRFPDCFLPDRETTGRAVKRFAGQSFREPQAPASLLRTLTSSDCESTRDRGPADALRKGPAADFTVALGSSERDARSRLSFVPPRALPASLESGG